MTMLSAAFRSTGAMLLILAMVLGFDINGASGTVKDGIAVEHATLLLKPADPSRLTGYLVIWNGADQGVTITEIASETTGEISILQTLTADGDTRRQKVEGGLTIPAHSELLMRPGGIYLEVDSGIAQLQESGKVTLRVLFADGTTKEVAADIRTSEAELEDHHHGMDH